MVQWLENFSDKSHEMLEYIFGALAGAESETVVSSSFGAVFEVFNSFVLTVGAVIVMFHLVEAVLRTAQSGEVMGRSWSSVWVPLRLALGFTALVPTVAGYSLLQAAVMWFTMQGVNAANVMWGVTVGNMAAPNVTQMIDAEAPSSMGLAREMLVSSMCNMSVNHNQNVIRQSQKRAGDDLEYSTFGITPQRDGDKYHIKYGQTERVDETFWSSDGFDDNTCGEITIVNAYPEWKDKVYEAGEHFESLKNFAGSKELNRLGNEFRELYANNILQLAGSIDRIAQNAWNNDFQEKKLIQAVEAFDKKNAEWIKTNLIGSNIGAIEWDAFVAESVKCGWACAGGMYFQMAQLTSTVESVKNLDPASFDYKEGTEKALKQAGVRDKIHIARTNQLISEAARIAESETDSRMVQKELENMAQASRGSDGASTDVDVNEKLVDAIGGAIKDSQYKMGLLESRVAGFNSSPILHTNQIGSFMIGTGQAGVIGGVVLGGTFSNFFAEKLGGDGMWSFLSPMIIGFVSFCFITGAILAYYIPMVPFIVWTGGILSWLVSIIEAIAVAPVWAISFLSPDGDGFMGEKSAQGRLLVFSVFLRPPLMVIGLLAALGVSIVLFNFINNFYFYVFDTVAGDAGWTMIVAWIAKWFIYAMLVIGTMNTAYSLITMIPDNVLRWIGGHNHALGDMGAQNGSAGVGQQMGAAGVGGALGAAASPKGAADVGQKLRGKGEENSVSGDDSPEKQATTGQEGGDIRGK